MDTQSRSRRGRRALEREPVVSAESESDHAIREALRKAKVPEVMQDAADADAMPSIVDRRRRGPLADTSVVAMGLYRRDGVLCWELASTPSVPTSEPGVRRAGAARRGSLETPIDHVEFEPLAPNDVYRFLAKTDDWLTPARGLRKIVADGDGFRAVPHAMAAGKASDTALLLVHGTFSKGDQYFADVDEMREWRKFLGKALGSYRHVVVFDHPTLSVSPMLNALDLARAMGPFAGQIDVVAHSRGGLVARWWLEHFERDPSRVRNAVLVGSPLAGTSLAAPRAIRKTLDFLSNVLGVIDKGAGLASSAVPLAGIVKAFARVTGTILHWAAESPIVDAAIALVPGLEAMSFVKGNGELERLAEPGRFDARKYATIEASFEPKSVGWKFWKVFTDKPVLRLADAGADFLFGGANDLVVDTLSMQALRGAGSVTTAVPKASERRELFVGDEVHHLSYFRSDVTVERLRGWLGVQ